MYTMKQEGSIFSELYPTFLLPQWMTCVETSWYDSDQREKWEIKQVLSTYRKIQSGKGEGEKEKEKERKRKKEEKQKRYFITSCKEQVLFKVSLGLRCTSIQQWRPLEKCNTIKHFSDTEIRLHCKSNKRYTDSCLK